jgi:hypothetical protein
MQCATIYLTKHAHFLHSASQTTCGVWIAGCPLNKLPLEVSQADLKRSLHDALAASKTEVQHPTDWDAVVYPLPEMAGMKSWSQFMRTARCVNIELDEGIIRFVVNTNRGPQEGFIPNGVTYEIPAESDDAAVAAALSDAFAQCQ